MCGRFGLFAELDALAEQFNFDPSIMQDIYSPALEHPSDGACADSAAFVERRSVRQEYRQTAALGYDWSAQSESQEQPAPIQRPAPRRCINCRRSGSHSESAAA